MQYLEGEWLLQHRVRSLEKHNDMEVKEVRQPNTAWYIMHKFQTIARQLQDFQPCCSRFERENPRLSRIPTCIIKSNEGKIAKVLSGTTFKSISFEENVDVEKSQHDLSDEELNNILLSEFNICLSEPLKFNFIMKKLEYV